MEQLIRNITSRITDKLSDDKPFYTPDDLREYDIPEFLIQRVEVEIYRNLNESVVPPHSEWADMGASEVELAWEKFIDAIVAEVRMPVSFAPTVFETAIADVLEMILQPRKSIPEILFGPKETLTTDELEKRLSFVSVNTHLASAIQKYVQRKGMSEIGIGPARHVVRRVDERVTANYNSLNWAQLLNPLFILAGPAVDTELFRIFFRDRNMDRISRRFDLLSGSLNKIEFIETLSSPDLLNEEGYEEDQASLFDVSESKSTAEDSTPGDDNENVNPSNRSLQDDFKTAPDVTGTDDVSLSEDEDDRPISEGPGGYADESDSILNSYSEKNTGSNTEFDAKIADLQQDQDELPETEQTNDSILGSFQKSGGKDQESPDETDPDQAPDQSRELSSERSIAEAAAGEKIDEDESHLNRKFDIVSKFPETGDDQEGDDEETEEQAQDRLKNEENGERDIAFNDQYGAESLEKDLSELSATDEAQEVPLSADDIDEDEDAPSEDESPIWQSFLSDEEHVENEDIPEFSAYADLEESPSDEEIEDVPLIDLTDGDSDITSADHLIGWMKDDEQRFVSAIFSGSDRAYEEALIDLEQLSNWGQASRFIEKEIFARNHVDMYDEIAVDFTDRLQTYFDEFKS